MFCFKLQDERYGFGRIISKVSIGHTAEIFNFALSSPSVSVEMLAVTARAFPRLFWIRIACLIREYPEIGGL
ncbi:hypothetical protein E2553_09115 [Paraburkholderia dipogonis]|uniref:Uncharacterized protein n=1 Tax=Paraburkholderia dipogonis TaxID=1211383 RepID=A0A4Y8NBN3_9BURK|nr:hypothetical protein E2553_09115 [Paraburkholderia dipogonis]